MNTSLKAGIIGLILVFLFMIFVYRLPGLASSLALVIYTEIVLVILNAFDVTLTLPGIAGIILSIGMAVDANVIIFARVREEMARGRSVLKVPEQSKDLRRLWQSVLWYQCLQHW